jgi:carboxypeptidase family protein/TonB-dependent receptor-like protein
MQFHSEQKKNYCSMANFSLLEGRLVRKASSSMSFTRFMPPIFSLLLAVLCLAFTALAQTETATISGLVTDSSGAFMVGVELRLQSVERGTVAVAKTNGAGLYVFTGVRPGQYQLSATEKGFKTADLLGVIVNVQDHIEQNFRLQVGSVSESVTVTGGAPLINTQDGSVSTVVDREFVENIPLNGRSFQELITLAPGVQTNQTSAGDQGQFAVNGQRANANYFTVDGVSANVGSWYFPGQYAQASAGTLPATNIQGGFNGLVSVDDLQEFRVLTSTFSPEFGRSPGAQVIMVTRSGTNQYHGAVYEYLRNEAFDANDWFANQLGLRRPPLRLNDYGGTLGGPIRLPGYDGRNRTFFFFSYENQGLKLPQALRSVVPTLAARQSATPDAAPILNAFPKPNGADLGLDGAAFNASYGAPTHSYAVSFRVDHQFNKKYSIFGRFNYSPSSSSSLNSYDLAETDITASDIQTYTVGATQAFNSRLVNDIRGNYTRSVGSANATITTLGGAVPPSNSVLWPAGKIPSEGYSSFSISNVGGSFNIGPTSGHENTNIPHQYEVVDNLTHVHGRHQFKFGADYRLIRSSISPIALGSNVIFANPTPDTSGIVTLNSGTDTFALFFNQAGQTIDYKAFSAYAQDTWRVSPRLTLTYGTRWEINPAPTTVAGQKPYTACCPSDLANLTLSAAGAPYYSTNYHDFAPRLGVAYQIVQTPGRQLVVRGGGGIFYDLGQSGAFGNNNWPYSNFLFDLGTPFPVPASFATFPPINPVPSPSNPASVAMADANFRLPRTYEWNATVEQAMGTSQVLSMAYVGARAHDLLRNETYANPNPDYSSVQLVTNNGFSTYDSLQVQFTRRLARGFESYASYTYSHSIDNASSDSGVVIPAQFAKTSIDKGNSTFDVRHTFNGALVYVVPAPNMNKLANAFLHNWSIQGIFTARSALPFDVLEGAFGIDPRYQAIARADIVPGQPLFLYSSTYPGGKAANPAAFTTLAPGETQGNLGRNLLRGFGLTQFDFSLRRQFKIKDRAAIEFRAEAFNIFNHPNFSNPGSYPGYGNYVGSPNFGQSPSMFGTGLGGGGNQGGFNPVFATGGPRDLQLALRIEF